MTVPANVTRFLFQIPSLKEELRVVGFAVELAVSATYACEIELACENRNLDLTALLGKSAVLTLFDARQPHYLHGEVDKVRQGETGNRFTLYHLTLVPRLQVLQYRSNKRIFQNKTVPEILSEVLQESDIQGQGVVFKLAARYPQREYCTQYQETDLDFVSRLMSEEGLYYFFEHYQHRHVLVVADHNSCFQAIAGDALVRFKERAGMVAGVESVYELSAQVAVQPGKVTLRDYNYHKSRLRLEESAQQGAFSALEHYHYAGNFEQPGQGQRYASIQLQAHQVGSLGVAGQSDCLRLRAGYRFSLHGHPFSALNAEYVLLNTALSGRQPQSLEEGSSNEGTSFSVLFSAMPAICDYRPKASIDPPRIAGTQTAFVTGPAGEDVYTDALGRVKVQFPWDSEGQYDQSSSCWLRVSQALAGNQWGAMVIPRIGQEVIVSFLGGNPDRPIIIGSLYNTANATPNNLPAHKTRTTFKSHSTPGGDGFNELRIDDKKGSEQIYLRGQKDLDLYVRNDWKEWVGNELHHTVGNNANQSIGGDQNTRINSSQHQKIGNNASQNVGQTLQLSISGSHVEQAGQLISLKAGMTLVIDAGVELTLKAGAGLVKLDPSGITIQGPLVRINSGGVAQAAKAAELTSPQVPVAAQTGAGPGKASAAAMPNQAVGVGDKHRAYTNEGGFISTLHPESTNRDFVAGMMGLTDTGIASRGVRVVPGTTYIGSSRGHPDLDYAPMNPPGRDGITAINNCTACTSSAMINKSKSITDPNQYITAMQVENANGLTRSTRTGGLSQQDSLAYIEKATGLQNKGDISFMKPESPAGNYAFYVGRRDGDLEHVLYAYKPNANNGVGRYVYDPQIDRYYDDWAEALTDKFGQYHGRGQSFHFGEK